MNGSIGIYIKSNLMGNQKIIFRKFLKGELWYVFYEMKNKLFMHLKIIFCRLLFELIQT